MNCPVCKTSVQSYYSNCTNCGLIFPGSEYFLNDRDFNNWRTAVLNASYAASKSREDVKEYRCTDIINASGVNTNKNGCGTSINDPFSIDISMVEAGQGTVLSMYIKEPDKNDKTLAYFYLPANILDKQVLVMKSGTSAFYMLVNVVDKNKPYAGSIKQSTVTQTSQPGKKGIDIVCVIGFILSFILPLIGLILCGIGKNRAVKNGTRGEGLAKVGKIIAYIILLLNLFWFGSKRNNNSSQKNETPDFRATFESVNDELNSGNGLIVTPS